MLIGLKPLIVSGFSSLGIKTKKDSFESSGRIRYSRVCFTNPTSAEPVVAYVCWKNAEATFMIKRKDLDSYKNCKIMILAIVVCLKNGT